MRILQVITDTDRRGAQVFAVDLHAELDRRGEVVKTVALAPGSRAGIDAPTLGPTRRSSRTIANLRRQAAGRDIVVAHGSTTLPISVIALAGKKTPLIYRQVSDSLFWAPTRTRRARVWMTLRRVRGIVALWRGSAQVLAEHFGVDPTRIRVIPNGVPAERFPVPSEAARTAARASFDIPSDRPVVAYVGALAPEKGIDLAFEAAARLGDLELLIAGDGPELPRLKELAGRRPAARVHFLGAVADPKPVYAAADVVVLPSRSDSMPAVLIEAGLSGLPVVATDVQAIPEIVTDGITGALVPVGDVDALAGAMASLVRDPRRAREMGSAARAHCLKRYEISVVADAWRDALHAFLDGTHRMSRTTERGHS